MNDLVNERLVGGNEFYTNGIFKAIQQITSRFKAQVESTTIRSVRKNEEVDSDGISNTLHIIEDDDITFDRSNDDYS